MKRICINRASSILDRDEETACTFYKIKTVNPNNSCDKFRQKINNKKGEEQNESKNYKWFI